MFFGKKPAVDTIPGGTAKPPKKRSTLGLLFNPDIGTTIRPLRENSRIFVQLVAMVFAAHGLFPRNHPALTGEPGAPRLTLSGVIATARSNLFFTREGLPQVLVFAAVIGCLGLGVLALFTIIFSLFVGKAHAAAGSGSPFQPVNQQQDIALGWINYLFFGQVMTNYLDNLGQVIPQSTVIQKALISALAYYSDAILIVAAFILFYHLASMIVETAHHGVVMGKRANQIWAPIRLVVAVGLLVPISSGLSCGQYIVIQIAEWGSNLASETWEIFLQALAADQYQPIIPNTPYARSVVSGLIQMEACAFAYNSWLTGGYIGAGNTSTSGSTTVSSIFPQFANSQMTLQQVVTPDNSTIWAFMPASANGQVWEDEDICGHYVILPMPPVASNFDTGGVEASVQQAVQQARDNTLQQMLPQYEQFAQSEMLYFLPNSIGGQDGAAIPPNIQFEQMISAYQTALQKNYQSGLSSNMSTVMQQIAQQSGDQGWVTAGAWFNTIARVQNAVMDTQALLPRVYPPNAAAALSKNNTPNTLRTETMDALERFQTWLAKETPSTTAGSGSLLDAAAGLVQTGGKDNVLYMDVIFAYIDLVASWNHVWQSGASDIAGELAQGPGSTTTPPVFSLGVQFTKTANPLFEIAEFGHANIQTAYEVFDDYINLLAVGATGVNIGKALAGVGEFARVGGGITGNTVGLLASIFGAGAQFTGNATIAIGDLLGIVTVAFFTSGFLLAYFLPLIPFFKFMFGIMSWLLSLLEAVIAVPMIALGHLNPAGDGLPGETGKQSYYFIFNLFLRPVLMVFGLIAGLLLFYITASAINMLYMTAVIGTGGINHAHVTLSRMVYSIIYVVILYMAANNSFKMIDWLPQHAIEWMGGRSLHHAPMGDPSEIAGYMGGAAGYVDNMLVKGAGTAAKAAGPVGLTALMSTGVGRQSIHDTGDRLGKSFTQLSGSKEAGDKIKNTWQGTTGFVEDMGAKGVYGAKAIRDWFTVTDEGKQYAKDHPEIFDAVSNLPATPPSEDSPPVPPPTKPPE